MRKKLPVEEEWLLFSSEKGKEFLLLLQKCSSEDIVISDALAELKKLRDMIFSTMHRLYRRSLEVLEEGALLLLLVGIREKGYSELEVLLCKEIETIGKQEKSFVYGSILDKKKKLGSEGWIYYGIKDVAGNRKKEARKMAKTLLSLLWEDIKDFGPFWNEFYGYRLT